MANPLSHLQTQHAHSADHKALLEAASRCYTDATRSDDVRMLASAAELALQAWQLNNSYLPGINLLARIALHRGLLDEARDWVNSGLALKADSTSLLYSAGHIALAANDLDEAETCFEHACRISRVNTKAAVFLAHVRLLKGDYVEAFQQYRELIKTRADDPQVRNKLFEATSYITADFYSQELEEELLRWFEFEDVDYSQLRGLTTSLLKHKLRLSEAGCPLEIETLAADPLLIKALSHFCFADPLFERLLMTLRQSILLSSSRQLAINSHFLPLVVAIAHQCELNDAVWYISPQEQSLTEQLTALAGRILTIDNLHSDDVTGLLLLIMMYQPLRTTSLFSRVAGAEWAWPEHLTALMNRAIRQPQALLQFAREIPDLGLSASSTSARVRAQYETHPYPSWNSLGYNQPADYYASLQALFPSQLNDLASGSHGINVLVAGCGTGRHALRLARYFHKLNVTAMDLSSASLAYAQMKAEEYRLNVDFVQGDILVSERLGQDFDVIECSGVLHHMKSPEAGLKALVARLRNGGLMKIALYSRQARTLVTELRKELAGDIPESESDIRRVREALLQQNSDDWAGIFQSPDFYNLSACRDLLFHAQEHVFDLQEIRRMIEHCGLDWVGIVPPAGARTLARNELKLAPENLTLNDWHTLEQLHPALFSGMYQFYVRKPQ